MGKPVPAPSYRDDPTLDDAFSLHTTHGDYEDDVPQLEDPPAYTDSADAPLLNSQPAGVETIVDEYPVIERNSRHYAFGKPVNSRAISMRMSPQLDKQPTCLWNYVGSVLMRLPPRPVVQINGYHTQTVRKGDKKEKKQVTDFDILLNLQPYILTDRQNKMSKWRKVTLAENGEKALRGSFRKTRAKGYQRDLEVGHASPDVADWCKEYCTSPAKLKIFRVSRTVTGLDQEAIRSRIETLIRSTHYRGHVNIYFPLEERAVDIYSTHWIHRWRTTAWIRWVFYLTFLWIFTWPFLYFFTKRWAVINVDWPFSTQANGDGTGRKQYATISEDEWVRKHERLVRRLVLQKHQGDASGFDLDEEPVNPQSRQCNSGNEHVDTAVNFVQAGIAGWNNVQRALGGDPDGWGGDC